jgi:hypothetical protein
MTLSQDLYAPAEKQLKTGIYAQIMSPSRVLLPNVKAGLRVTFWAAGT